MPASNRWRMPGVGDTITLDNDPADAPLPGYKKMQSMVYCGIYPAEGEKYESVREALEKLQLNDAAFMFEPETSTALGFGFRCELWDCSIWKSSWSGWKGSLI